MSEQSQTADELAPRAEQEIEIDESKSAPKDRAEQGPFDASEVPSMRPYVDLGGIKVQPREGLQLRLEVEEKTKRVVAVTLEYQGSRLQMQAFAAPSSTGLWNGIRHQIAQQMASQTAEVREEVGPLGPELVVVTPAPEGNGSRALRFIAVDGPRWTLRGVIMGQAALNAEARKSIIEVFRETVVVRGDGPLPPSELLSLRVPAGAQAAGGQGGASA